MCNVTVLFVSSSFEPAVGAGGVGLGGGLTQRPPPSEVMILVAHAVAVAAGAPRAALAEEVGHLDGGVGGDVDAGEGGSAAVDTPSITLIIAAPLPPIGPAARPLPNLTLRHGPND